MRARFFSRITGVLLTAAALGACTQGGPSAPLGAGSQWAAGLERVRSEIAAATGHTPEVIDVTASPVHLRITVSDAKLAQSDQATRENSANAMVAAAESAMAGQEPFKSTQVISVAIIHAAPAGAPDSDSHVEDVLDFRKGPNQRFSHQIT